MADTPLTVIEPVLGHIGIIIRNAIQYFGAVNNAHSRCKDCKKRLDGQLDILRQFKFAVNLEFLLDPVAREELEGRFKECEKEAGDLQESVSKAGVSLKRIPRRFTWPCFEKRIEKKIHELDTHILDLNALCERYDTF